MDLDDLARRLGDPDPRARVEALRILAMVEETRALDAVRWVFNHDPEAGVREVAEWAGRLIFTAQQRGYTPEQAMEEIFARPLPTEHQELFLESLAQTDLRFTRHPRTQQYAVDQTYRRRLADVMRGEETPVASELPLLPSTLTASLPSPTSASEPGDLDLLDAGLSRHFWEEIS